MLLLKSSNGGSPRDVAGGMLDDDDDDDGSSSDIVTPTSSSTPSRSIRNFFRKRHKSVTIGFVDSLIKIHSFHRFVKSLPLNN